MHKRFRRELAVGILAIIVSMLMGSVVMADNNTSRYRIPLTYNDAVLVNTLISVDGGIGSMLRMTPRPGVEAPEDMDLLNMREPESGGNNFIVFNRPAFLAATERSRTSALSDLVRGLQESNINPQTQQSIFDQLRLFDRDVAGLLVPIIFGQTHADLFAAFRIVAPILPLVRVVLGILAVTIVFLLMLSTVIDLMYIGLPFLREYGSKDSSGGSKIPGVSWDAVTSVMETESSLGSKGSERSGYKNAYVVYFKRRVVTYVVLSICILYLVVGELGGLIASIINLASGIVQ